MYLELYCRAYSVMYLELYCRAYSVMYLELYCRAYSVMYLELYCRAYSVMYFETRKTPSSKLIKTMLPCSYIAFINIILNHLSL
jgi:hypothetical protein